VQLGCQLPHALRMQDGPRECACVYTCIYTYAPLHTNPFCLRLQGLVSRLVANQPLMLLQEPSNPFDPHAVSVQTLRGEMLGYVPMLEGLNQEVQLGISYGRVLSAGLAKGVSLFGAHAGGPCVPCFVRDSQCAYTSCHAGIWTS